MSMRFNDDEEESIVAEINITPLTDIFLVLLIIFMLSSSAMLEGGLQVKLPTAKSTALTKTQGGKPTYVTISKDGQISVNKIPAPEKQLNEIIKQALSQSPERTV